MEHIKPKNTAAFRKAVQQARKDGMVAIIPRMGHSVRSVTDTADQSLTAQWEAMSSVVPDLAPIVDESGKASVHRSLEASTTDTTATVPEGSPSAPAVRKPSDGLRRGGIMGTSAAMLDYSQVLTIPTPDNVGSPHAGYVPWGAANDMPAQIFKTSSALPYTATGLQYLADTATGLGIRLMYWLGRWSGGTVTDEYIPYEKAGVYLRERERTLLEKLMAAAPLPASPEGEVAGASAPVPDGSPSVSAPVPDASSVSAYRQQLIDSYARELAALRESITQWEQTMEWWTEFKDNNNLDQHFQACMAEDVRYDLCFPTVLLEQGRSGRWNPKITGIGKLDAIITRYEQPTRTSTDSEYLPRYVYMSESWRCDPFTDRSTFGADLTAIPVTMPCHGLRHMREYVAANQRTRVGSRQLEWCCPQYYPTPGKLYPQPAWWSIYPSQVMQYAATLIYDKSVARKNSTMWGKILFLNINYLQKIFDQEGADTPEAQQAIRDSIYNDCEDFLKRRDNNGKLLLMDSYMSADEKNLIDSVRIVDVPQSTTAATSDGELSQITSIIYFALGIHPGLVGSDTTKGTSSSGTFQRELHLLKAAQMSPRQRRMLYFYNSILSFNNLDPNAIFCVKQATLTTLDNSKTGMTEETKE